MPDSRHHKQGIIKNKWQQNEEINVQYSIVKSITHHMVSLGSWYEHVGWLHSAPAFPTHQAKEKHHQLLFTAEFNGII